VRTYAKRYSTIYEVAVAERRLHTVVEHLLTESVLEFTQPADERPGCLISSATMADEPQKPNARAFVADLQRADEQLLRERIQQAVRSRELVEGTDGAALTHVIQAMWQGLSSRAGKGAGREELLAAAKAGRFAHRPANDDLSMWICTVNGTVLASYLAPFGRLRAGPGVRWCR